MGPQILWLPRSSVDSYKSSLSAIDALRPEDDAWLSFKKSANECVVLGHLAKQFHGTPKLDQLKFEQGAAKLMAAIGSIIQKEGLDPEIEVIVSTLLPFGEYVNRVQLEQQFRREAKNYYFRNQKINVYTNTFTCLPEGGGFIASRIREQGEEWFADRKVVVLMCGHRNTSLLVFDKGGMSQNSQTTNLGFINLVDSVIQRTSLNEAEKLTKAIYRMGDDVSPENPSLRLLLKSFDPDNFEREANDLASAIQAAREEYWALLKDWLESAVPRELDEMIIAGGGAHYLKGRLDRYLSWAEPAWNAGGVPSQLSSLFASHPDGDSLAIRFCDVYALHLGLYKKPTDCLMMR